MSNRYRQFLPRFSTEPALKKINALMALKRVRVALLLLVLVIISLRLLVHVNGGAGGVFGFTSDDVAQQTVLAQWEKHGASGAMLGNDNWAVKYPLYIATNHLDISPQARATLSAWALVTATIILMVVILWKIIDLEIDAKYRFRGLVYLLPILMAVSVSPTIITLMAGINARNIEIPIFLFLTYLLLNYEKYSRSGSLKQALTAIILIGILLFDDPLFKFMGLFSLLAVYIGRLVLGWSTFDRVIRVVGASFAGMALAVILNVIFMQLLSVYYIERPSEISTFPAFVIHLQMAVSQNLELFNANFWGRKLGFGAGVTSLNALIVGIGLVASWRLLWQKGARLGSNAAHQYIGLLLPWSILVVSLSGFDAETRYFILTPFILYLSLVIAASREVIGSRLIIILALLLGIAGLYNISKSVQDFTTAPMRAVNVEQKELSKILQERNLTKGMATFWRANINSFYTNYQTDVLSVSCWNESKRVTYNPILSATGVIKSYADKSFILFYPESSASGGEEECKLETIIHKFGPPDEIIEIPTEQKGRIAIYNRDVVPNLISGANQ